MGMYTIISDVGNAIIKLLRENLVPDIVSSPDRIGLCSPGDRGDASLSVNLYDVRESEEVHMTGMLSAEVDWQKYPPMFLSLYYMITAYSGSDIRFRSTEEQKILGKAMQVLKDYPVLSAKTLEPVNTIKPMDIHIAMLSIDQDEKLKLWSIPNQPYKLSVFYKVAPIELESVKTKKIQRVAEIEFDIRERI